MTRKDIDWITIKGPDNDENIPASIRIDMKGNVFIDGKPYDENNTNYKNLSVNVEEHSKLNTGEETKKMIESQKDAREGETKVIKDVKDDNKTEKTSVKF